MNYIEIRKLDEDTAQKLTEGRGPSDKCICSILSPPENARKGFRASIKKALASIGQGRKRKVIPGNRSIEIPFTYSKGGKGIYTAKGAVIRESSCGKCGCDRDDIVLKHSYANVRIITPDVSSLCPCPTDCLPDKEKIMNKIKVTVEHLVLDVDSVESEFNMYGREDIQTIKEPILSDKRSITSLIDAQYADDDLINRNDEE